MQTTIRGRLTCFCRVCYVMWYGQEECDEWYVMYEIDHVLVIGFTTWMSMNRTTGRIHRSCLNLLYEMQRQVGYFTLLLNISYSSTSNRLAWRLHGDTMMEIMMMEIIGSCRWQWWSWVPRRWRSREQDDNGHIMSLYDLHLMFIMFLYLICLERW